VAKRSVFQRPATGFATEAQLTRIRGIGPKTLLRIQTRFSTATLAKAAIVVTEANKKDHKNEETKQQQQQQHAQHAHIISVKERLDAKLKPVKKFKKPSTARIGHWNVCHFSLKKTEAQLVRICTVLREFDLVAILELRDPRVIELLVTDTKYLAPEYDALVSPKFTYGRSEKQRFKEYYAFVYRRDTVRVMAPPALVPDPDELWWRPPFIGYFRVNKFDFCLVTIHSIWKDGKSDAQMEAAQLDDLLRKASQFIPEERDFILTGDFNLSYADSNWEMGNKYIALIKRPQYTTFSKRKENASIYDNMWINVATVPLFLRARAIYFDRECESRAAARENKDHPPHKIGNKKKRDMDDAATLAVDFEQLKFTSKDL
jgi:hypothetical protein